MPKDEKGKEQKNRQTSILESEPLSQTWNMQPPDAQNAAGSLVLAAECLQIQSPLKISIRTALQRTVLWTGLFYYMKTEHQTTYVLSICYSQNFEELLL